MPERQAVRVQSVTADNCNRAGRRAIGSRLSAIGRTGDRISVWVFFNPAEGAVELVLDDWVTDVGEVNSNLMLSAGDRLRLDQRVIPKAFENFEVRQC